MDAAQTTGSKIERSIGFIGATGIGVGAIVGGGILALAGVAFAAAGPAAILAFAANAVIAIITALSFAEMSTRFPESGGTYTYAKKVLSVEAAFIVGWVVWFASMVAAMLYAVGFAAFAAAGIEGIWAARTGEAPEWITGRPMQIVLSVGAIALFTAGLTRKAGGGGQWINIAKMLVFAILIAAGLWAVTGRTASQMRESLSPFFEHGALGVIQAMGFTFIAFQGFDLIAAVGGEVRDPQRNLPRAMITSLLLALVVYLPLLFLIATVGTDPGESITALSRDNPETIVAIAAENYLGAFGYWLVVVAGVLAMLSALQANILAASRIGFTMAIDRTLPRALGTVRVGSGAPVKAVLFSAAAIAILTAIVPDVARAGAAASLIFLITFAAAHWTAILARRRSVAREGVFQVPLFPFVPAAGLLACVGLAVFQGFAVPAAGIIIAIWLVAGGILFVILFARHARIVDATVQALDPELARLRGRSPMVLVPIANPAHAASMVAVAHALAPPGIGRVLLLSVIAPPSAEEMEVSEPPRALENAQRVLGEALNASFACNLFPEALATVSPQPWAEIARVARTHNCGSLLVGLSEEERIDGTPLENLIGNVDTDVAVLRAPEGWTVQNVKRILVPVRGRGDHDALRARLLASFFRMEARAVTFLQLMPAGTPQRELEANRYQLLQFAHHEVRGHSEAAVVATQDVAGEIARQAADYDLVILGLRRVARRHKFFGDVAMSIARNTNTAIIMLSRRG